ncbi:histone deacetylase family protein [Leeia sp. TBRC 13508]|uniref:Histone deacetylase family protein n=1 Tax=Leeia speluncae TaxID=2884804 RepID=A0ABS8D5K4_9NEIS|nr:histone deacetylase family protein [Leeia speluncae]MCB6183251.1 histone deacetylase family protein [Leeia speluncae]
MLTIYSDTHRLHYGQAELMDGKMQPCFEKPSRADMVLDRVKAVGLGEVRGPDEFGQSPLLRVHSAAYVEFLENAWKEWSALGRSHDALPLVWPVRGLRTDRIPADIDGKLGYFAMDAGVPITAGTWEAIRQSANVAMTAMQEVANGAKSAFALCRPPGHHAAADYMGGYCYLNNAAIAAQALLDRGAKKVAILDVDYHHGNGTQSIFYDRADVMFVSIHGDPMVEYPHFLGFADEYGAGPGFGFNHNYPLPHGAAWPMYEQALADGIRKIQAYAPDAVVVSLGVDTFKDDPISQFKLENSDYLTMGKMIAEIASPTLFVMEGGYAVEDIGVNAVNVLLGFEGK